MSLSRSVVPNARAGADPVAAGTPAVELRDVELRYMSLSGATSALQSISLRVEPGEFVAIVGPSGCGKSTCLSLVSGLMRPSGGAVEVNGQPVRRPTGTVGYMLQRDELLPWRTILENAVIGAEILGRDLKRAREVALELISRYGLDGFEHKHPGELSGGMRQRAALIRTLVTEPQVLLLDEPFSALDFQTRLAIADEMANVFREGGRTAVLVTHDIGEAICMADRVVVLTHRPGRIKSEYRIDLRRHTTSTFEMRAMPEYGELFNAIWEDLEVTVDE